MSRPSRMKLPLSHLSPTTWVVLITAVVLVTAVVVWALWFAKPMYPFLD